MEAKNRNLVNAKYDKMAAHDTDTERVTYMQSKQN